MPQVRKIMSKALPQTIPYFLFDQLRQAIIKWHYRPGENLRAQEIADRFGSSRGAVREALRLLEVKGVAVYSSRRGFRVRKYTYKELLDMYQLRSLLEATIIDNLFNKDLSDLKSHLDISVNHMADYLYANDLDSYFDENANFHHFLLRQSGNLPLMQVLEKLNEMSLPVRYALLRKTFNEGRSLLYHRQILESIEKEELTEARKLTVKHIMENFEKAWVAYEKAINAVEVN